MQSVFPDRQPDKELELKINAYMALYHIHPEIQSPLKDEELVLDITATRLEEFRAYLETDGAEFANQENFVHYFSIPYILSVDTERNTGIQEIFKKQWLTDLETELVQAVEYMCKLLVMAAEQQYDEDSTESRLQHIIEFYYKQKPQYTKQPDPRSLRYGEIEMEAEILSHQIEELRTKSVKAREQLNLAANKHELMRDQYRLFMIDLEDRSQVYQDALKVYLVAENQTFKKLQDDRAVLEEEVIQNKLRSEKKRKFSKEEIRNMRLEFRQTIDTYDIYDFQKSDNSSLMMQRELIWRRGLLTYSNAVADLDSAVDSGAIDKSTSDEINKQVPDK